MLHVTFDNTKISITTRLWHVNGAGYESNTLFLRENAGMVTEVYMDGDEMQFLLRYYGITANPYKLEGGEPYPSFTHQKSVYYFGDMAKFIVANLPLKTT